MRISTNVLDFKLPINGIPARIPQQQKQLCRKFEFAFELFFALALGHETKIDGILQVPYSTGISSKPLFNEMLLRYICVTTVNKMIGNPSFKLFFYLV